MSADSSSAAVGSSQADVVEQLRQRPRWADHVVHSTRSARLPAVVIVAFFAVGFVIRAWVLRSPLGDADSDEAVTGLMAMHFQDGEFRALYWGATYAGTFEPIVTAVVFSIVGPSTIALKAVPIAFTFVASLLMWRAAKEYFGPSHGPLEGAVYWVYPAASVLILMKAQVVYASGACFVVALLLLAFRMTTNARPHHFLLFGLLAGMSLWATPLALATILPIGLVTLGYTWRKPVLNLLVVPTMLLGALPWLWHSIENDWSTLRQVGTITTTYRSRVQGCFLELYPLLLGLRRPLTLEWVVAPTIGRVIFVVLFGAMLVLPVRRYGRRALVLVIPVVTFPFLYAVSTTSWYRLEPRHGMFIAPLLLLLAVSLVPRAMPLQLGVFVLLVAMTASTLAFVRDMGEAVPGLATVRPGKLAPVLESMRSRGLDSCYADYWIAYRVSFESEEDVICAAYWGDRYPAYREQADRDEARTYLFLDGTPNADSFRRRLTELRVSFDETQFDTVVMFVLDEPRRPDEINQCIRVEWLAEPTCPT